MRNQCMEQCAIYTFLPVGPTWNGLFWPNIPLFGYSWIQCLEGKLLRDPSGVDGIWYLVMRISVDGWFHVVGRNGYVTNLGCLVEGYLQCGVGGQ